MKKQTKIQILAALSVAVVVLIVLSASLAQVEFRAGKSFHLGNPEAVVAGESASLQGGDTILRVLRGMLALVLALLPIYIIFNLLTREGRGRLIADLVALLVIVLLFSLVPDNLEAPEAETPVLPETAEEAPGGLLTTQPIDEFVAEVPPWLDLVAVAALAALIAGVVVGVVWWISKRKAKPTPAGPLEQLASEAQEALDALRAGRDVRDTVIRSYIRMSEVVQQARGVRRERVMTPYEFELYLAQHGFPHEPIETLTRLFEKSRYGHEAASAEDEQAAIASLRAIVAHCGGEAVSNG
ncbi:MAG: DUF4129 domain-containing protein [Anaerolineales bacterium]|nr:DUF4129 domain-containing protein [Anaerolineales bacterium]